MTEPQVLISELKKEDLPFLFELWWIAEVVRYADEFPGLRGWSKFEQAEIAWQKYQARRAELGLAYSQMILKFESGTRIGESFFAPLQPGYTFGRWEKPAGKSSVMGDVKLLPAYWGRGLATEGMRQIVKWVFAHTDCDLFVVPPHRNNPAAECVYEKAGFVLFRKMRSWRNHKIMELTRKRFSEIYG